VPPLVLPAIELPEPPELAPAELAPAELVPAELAPAALEESALEPPPQAASDKTAINAGANRTKRDFMPKMRAIRMPAPTSLKFRPRRDDRAINVTPTRSLARPNPA